FQAEDGIRYRNVTGVQTCALPISISIPVGIVGYFAAKIINKRQYAMSVEVLEQMQLAPASEEGATKLSDKINPPGVALVTSLIRSEERRVGKECRSLCPMSS